MQDAEETEMLPIFDVADMGTFIVLLYWFKHPVLSHFIDKHEFSSKTHKFPRSLPASLRFERGPVPYLMLLEFALHKFIEIFRKCPKNMMKNHTLLKSYGRLGS